MDEPSSPPRLSSTLDVTALPPAGALLDALTDQLAAWMPGQRWYAHKGAGTPVVAIRGWAPLRTAPDHLVLMAVVGAAVAGGEALYQVPLVLRRPEGDASPAAARPAPPAPAGVRADTAESRREEGSQIGVVAVPGGPLRADDATRDPDGRAALLGLIAEGGGALGAELRLSADRTARPDALPRGPGTRSRSLSGEQSNSSMIFEADPPGAARPVIIKLFRLLQDGENPDVILQGALGGVGSTRVPPPLGSVRLALGQLRTHALFAQEFLPDVEDAWRTALDQARRGADFTGPARALGEAVAEVHRDLGRALGTLRTDQAAAEAMVAQMRERLDQVASELPQVQAHRAPLEQLLGAALEVAWPPMQRIHGDLHLGQVLASPDRGWMLLDFEGEPLRPLRQRSRPDSPLRDVAGMLRSLDYAAGAVAQEHGADASAWALSARQAFLDGYVRTAGLPTGSGSSSATGGVSSATGEVADALRTLIAAFEADKAVYEALYEARNRPAWLPIPLAALERISAAAAAAG